MSTRHQILIATAICVLLLTIDAGMGIASANEPPVAEAGLPRYAARDPVQLDGSGSYAPDGSAPLSYAWTQISGLPVVITGADTATPQINGFVQTDGIQECVFELVVSDGERPSIPDTVKVVIVPHFGPTTLMLENPPFQDSRPTAIYFGGGNGTVGNPGQRWGIWHDLANVISFPEGYEPDTSGPEWWRTYYRPGDMIIVYLSSVAPDYTGMIQTMGWSTGGQPAVDVAIRLNRFYRDPRYAVNQVTELDAFSRGLNEPTGAHIETHALLHSSDVDGEPLRHDKYWSEGHRLLNVPRDLIGVYMEGVTHAGVRDWYKSSLTSETANQFNHGVVAGAFWSVVGPGGNLRVRTDTVGYYFDWTAERGMVMFDEGAYPGRLPEPVTLLGPSQGAGVGAEGAVLTCKDSENAEGYRLMFGRDPFHMVYRVADTPTPPKETVTAFPFETTWWTIMANDRYGSTIYADPVCLSAANVVPQTIENRSSGQTYASIQQAIDDAHAEDEIVLGAGIWQYLENLDFKGKGLTLRSADPNDALVVGTTVICGYDSRPIVTLSSCEGKPPTLDGLTLTGGTVAISCRDAAPTISRCTIAGNGPVAIEFWYGHEPTLIDCTLIGRMTEGGDRSLIAHWKLDETEGSVAHDSAIGYDGMLNGDPVWEPAGGHIDGALRYDGVDDYLRTPRILNPADGPFSVFAWVQGDGPGKVILSQEDGADWLMVQNGKLTTALTSGRGGPLASSVVVTDGAWHQVGCVRDGSDRVLYVDGIEVARDTVISLKPDSGGFHIGAGKSLEPGSFWQGLIDDVRIYDRAVAP